MIVDVHTHLWDSLEQLGPASAQRVRERDDPPWDRPDATPQAHDLAMQGVSYVFILGLRSRRIDAHIPAARVAAWVARRPDKYIGFAGIDPAATDSPAGGLEQLAEALALKLSGIVISPPTQGASINDRRTMAILERCQTHGLPVMIHPDTHLARVSHMDLVSPLLINEVARSFPGLKLVMAQVGSPSLLQTMTLLDLQPNVFAEVSDIASRAGQLRQALLMAHERGVTGKLFLGSDFPFSTPQRTAANLYAAHTAGRGSSLPNVPREAVRTIVECDVLARLGIPAPPPRPHLESEPADPADPSPASKGMHA